MADGDAPIEPRTWHHGLIARWWAEFNVDGPEIAYFQRFIREGGEPALDVACGTGRLLVPFLEAGLDVDGCDVSPDMLALCRERAERAGLSPNLYPQAMHRLDLPRRYRTIVVCGAFGLGGNREHDVEALHRLHDHLEPGGLLLMDNEVPYADARLWHAWTKDERHELPTSYREPGARRRASDGTDLELRSRLLAVDPLAQRVTMQMRALQWQGDELIGDEEHELQMTVYFTHELVLMLHEAGFPEVRLEADHTNAEPTADTDFVVFIARRPQ